MKEKRAWRNPKNYIVAVLVSVLVAAATVYLSLYTGFYQQGNTVYGQLYKLEVIKEALDAGKLYPLYVQQWYNGYEMFRYTAPLPYILICLMTYLPYVDIVTAISLFHGLLAFISMLGFFAFGIRQQKLMASFFVGIAFLLMPTTLCMAVEQCRFDILMGMAIMPGLLFWTFEFLEWEHRRALLPFSCLLIVLIAANYVLAIAFGMVLLLYLAVHMLSRRTWRFETALAGNLILVYLIMGYFLYPAIAGGLLSRKYALVGSWNITAGYSLMIIGVLGLFLSDKARIAGFLVAIIGMLLSYSMCEDVLKLIPFPALQSSYWYLMTATVLCLVMLLFWERLRLSILIVMMGVVVLENSTLLLSLGESQQIAAEEEQLIEDYLIAEASAITDNRLALMDNTILGDIPHWYMASNGVSSAFGWDSGNAMTERNQYNLTEAFSDKFYDYMFDRLLLYGNDTIIVLKQLIKEDWAYGALLEAAANRHYAVRLENEKVIVFKSEEVNAAYGVITQYENLAIGENAAVIAYIYPSFGLGSRICLEDYTVDELVKYKRLYLSGFTYREKEKAENMLRELAAKGVKIYIDMQHIPINELTGKNEFMGVYAQFIQFTEDFPILENDNGNQFKLDFRTVTDTTWNTVYVSGCDDILKEAIYEGRKHLAYLARNSESDVTFMGFNLIYYYLATHNADLKRFLDEALDFSGELEYSESEIVPITIEYSQEHVKVSTDRDGVNCNLAAVETLVPDRVLSTQEDMWVINQGDTTFRIERPCNTEGMFFSIVGGIGIVLLWILVYVILEPIPRKPKTGSV